jgi:exodeoxyribonuclease-1
MSQFLWYDLETFGRDSRRSRIAQFAAIRTDAQLQAVEPARVWYCQPSDDLLPSPTACLITGITPQLARDKGVPEAEFAARIHEEMSRPDTCVAGFNSIRFDDEFIRNLFYRNFYDPYEREWRNGNSRWDLIDPIRLAHALRPDGIHWPKREDGASSFKLEHLATANQLKQARAHDAKSDVEATIGLAALLRQAQPRLFDYALALRDKKRAAAMIDYATMTPVLHISQRYPAAQACAALVLPICAHPSNANGIIVCDLADDPTALIELPIDDILDRLYTARADLPDDVARIGLKQIHLNKSPMLVALQHLSAAQLARFGIELAPQLEHAQRLRQTDGLAEKVRAVFAKNTFDNAPLDPELAIYQGFASPYDKSLFTRVRREADKTTGGFGFRDARFEPLALRYRARNYPNSLRGDERDQWQDYRCQRLAPGSDLSEYDFDTYFAEIQSLRASDDAEAHRILDQLDDWGRTLQRSL